MGDPVGGSENYRKNAREIDSRMYGGIGGFFGFTLTVVLCKTVFSGMWLSSNWPSKPTFSFCATQNAIPLRCRFPNEPDHLVSAR
jgi:hypothetical protein